MRIVLVLAVSALALAACNPASSEGGAGGEAAPSAPETEPAQSSAVAATPNVQGPDAEFIRDDPSRAAMGLTREGGQWRVAFRAGGAPNGAATAADCEIEAVGPQDGDDVISARPVPFNSELGGMTAADIGAAPPVIEVRVGPEGVFVADGGAASRYCAMGSDIDGFYKRVETPD